MIPNRSLTHFWKLWISIITGVRLSLAILHNLEYWMGFLRFSRCVVRFEGVIGALVVSLTLGHSSVVQFQ